MLDNEIHGNQPQQDLYDVRGKNKDPSRVAGGLKAYSLPGDTFIQHADYYAGLRRTNGSRIVVRRALAISWTS